MSARTAYEDRLIRMFAALERKSTVEYLASVDPHELRGRLAQYFIIGPREPTR